MAQAGLQFGSPLDPLVPAPTASADTGSAFLQQSLADIAVLGETALQQVNIKPPKAAPQAAPSIAYSPSTKQFFVQGRTFAEDDAQSAIESEALLGQPGAALPQGGDWVPVDPQSYAGYLQGIKEPSLGTLFTKGFGRGVDTLQLLGGYGLSAIGAEKTGQGIVRQQLKDLNKTAPYARKFTDIDSGRGAVEWFVSTLGEFGPQIIETGLTALAGAGAGAVAGGGANPFTAAGGALASILGKQAVKQSVLAAAKKYAAGEAVDAAQMQLLRKYAGITAAGQLNDTVMYGTSRGVTLTGQQLAARELRNNARRVDVLTKRGRAQAISGGAGAATIASGYGKSVGEIYGSSVEGGDPNRAAAFGLGILGAGFEFLPEFALASRLMGGPAARLFANRAYSGGVGKEVLRRGATGIVGGGILEGSTEGAQELLNLAVDPTVDFNSPEGVEQVINAFAAGTAIGGTLGLTNLASRAPENLLSPGITVEPPAASSQVTPDGAPAPVGGLPAVIPGTGLAPSQGRDLLVPGTAVVPTYQQEFTAVAPPTLSGQQQLMLPPPGAVLQVQGQPDFVVDEDGNIRAATPDDVVVGISDRGFVPPTTPGTQGVLDVFPGGQTTTRELRGMMEQPGAAPTVLLQPEGVTGEVPTAPADTSQGVLPFESGLAPRYMAQPQAPTGTLAGNEQLAALQDALARRQAQEEQFAGVQPVVTPEVGALEQRLAESQPFLDVMGTEGRLTPEPQYGVTEDEARQAWLDTKAGRVRNWGQLSANVRNQWIDALNGNYTADDLKQIKRDLSSAESVARLNKSTPRVVVTGAITPTPVAKKEPPRAAKKPKANALVRGEQTGTARPAPTQRVARPAAAGTRPTPTQKSRQETAVDVQDVKADPQYKPTLAAIDAAFKDGVIDGKDRIRLIAGLNKDGDFELVADTLKQKREAAAKKSAPKKSAPAPAPKAAALKKGKNAKPALTYDAVRQEIEGDYAGRTISADQFDELMTNVERKKLSPAEIKAKLDFFIKGGKVKKVAPGEARGLRDEAKDTNKAEDTAAAEPAGGLTVDERKYILLNNEIDDALKAKEIYPLQMRVLKDMVAQRKPLAEIRRTLIGFTGANKSMIMERTGDEAGGGITVSEAEAAIKRATGAWRTGTKTKVWENFDAVPADLRMQLSGPTVLGFYDTLTNTVHVIAGNHLSGSEVVATVYHEILGHRGLRDRFGEQALSILNAIYRTNKETKAFADAYLKKTGKWKDDPNRFAYAVEEILAKTSESGRFKATLWERLVNLVREFGRRVGFNIAYNNADVATILAMAHDSIIEGTGRVKGLIRTAIDSPLMERQARLDEMIDGMPSSLRDPVRTVTDTFSGVGIRTVSRFGLRDQVLRLAKSLGIKSAARFEAAIASRERTLTRHEQPFLKWAEGYGKLPQAERGVGEGTVSGLIEKMTRTEKWAFMPDYFVGDDREALDKIELDTDLKRWYDGLSTEGQKSVREAYRLNYQQLKDMQKAVLDNTATQFDALIEAAKDETAKKKLTAEKAASLDRYRTMLQMDPTRPYAPLRQDGDWVVVGRSKELVDAIKANDYSTVRKLEESADHYYVDFASTRAEAAKMARGIEADYEATQFFRKAQSEENLYGGGDVMYAFQKLNALMQDLQVKDEMKQQVRNAVAQLQLQVMAANSARKSELRRRNIATGNVDMVKTTLSHGRSTAQFIASVSHNDKILESLRLMGQEVRTFGPDREAKQEVYNSIVGHYMAGLQPQPQNTLADKLTGFSSGWMLLLSPSYYIQQVLQNLMLTMPAVAARYGYSDTSAAFKKAYAQVAKAWVDTGVTGQLNIDLIDEKYRPLAIFISESGALDVGLDREMGSLTADSGGSNSKPFEKAINFLRGTTRKIEAINRLSAAIAVYELSGSEGRGAPVSVDAAAYSEYKKDFEATYPELTALTPKRYAAALEALSTINETHGDYSFANASNFLRNPLGRVVFQFQKFRMIVAGLYVRAFYNAFRDPNLSPAERRVARRTLMFVSGHAAIMGGLIGSPAAAIFVLIYNLLSGDDEERGDLERDIREAVGDDTIANLLLRGVPSLAGVDVSGTLGLGNLLSVAPYTDLPSDRESYAKYILSLTGPAIGGIGANTFDAVSLMGDGNYYKALERLMPRGIGAASKSLRETTTGETTARGDTLTQPIDLGAVEAIWGTLGLSPIARVNRQYARNQFYKDEKFYQDRAADIKRAYADAYKDDNSTAMTALRLEWRGLQDARRERGFKTQSVLDLVKAPREQALREKRTVGGVPFTPGTEGRARQITETAGTAR